LGWDRNHGAFVASAFGFLDSNSAALALTRFQNLLRKALISEAFCYQICTAFASSAPNLLRLFRMHCAIVVSPLLCVSQTVWLPASSLLPHVTNVYNS
jgi:hypothetical protein